MGNKAQNSILDVIKQQEVNKEKFILSLSLSLSLSFSFTTIKSSEKSFGSSSQPSPPAIIIICKLVASFYFSSPVLYPGLQSDWETGLVVVERLSSSNP